MILSSFMARDEEDTQIEVLSDVWGSEPPSRGRNAPFAWGEEAPPRSQPGEDTGAIAAAAQLWGEEPPTRDPLIGMKLGEYELRSRIGVGGMGFVYDGIQPLIGKRVAVKVLRPELAQAPEQVARLLAEARAVNAIRHRGIIDIFGFGQVPDGRQYIVMEFLDGQPLDAYLAEKQRLPPTEALSILDEVLAALGAAHGAGVVHRDLKPSNIFLVREPGGTRYVKLLDFGLAKQGQSGAAARTAQTRTDMVVGTPEYMAPEQARGQAVGPMTDLYAMGVVTFEMVTGRLPFIGTSPVDLLMKHVDARPPRPSEFVPELPPALDAFILQMLTKDPEARPSSADALRQQLHRLRRTMLRPTRAQGAAGARIPTPAPAPAAVDPSVSTGTSPAIHVSPMAAEPAPAPALVGNPQPRSELATVPNEIVKVEEPLARRPTAPLPISPELIPSSVQAPIRPSPTRRVMPVVIGAVAFLAVVGLLIWGRSTPTPNPVPPVATPTNPVAVPDKPVQQTPPPVPPVTPPANPTGTTPPAVSPNPATPPTSASPTETPKTPDDGKTVAQNDSSKAPPKSHPHSGGSVPGAAEMLDNIDRLERDIDARLAAGQKVPAADMARGQLRQMRAETRKAKSADKLREIGTSLDFLEKNLLKR